MLFFGGMLHKFAFKTKCYLYIEKKKKKKKAFHILENSKMKVLHVERMYANI